MGGDAGSTLVAATVSVVGGEPAQRERYAAELRGAGFAVLVEAALGLDPESAPEGVLLLAGGMSSRRDGVGALLDAIADTRRHRPSGVIVACLPRSDGEALTAAIDSGAEDVLLLPLATGELVARIRAASAQAMARRTARDAERYGAALLAAGAMIRDGVDLEEALSDWLQQVCEAVGLGRGILLLCTDDDAGALLVAASDDAKINRVPIDLDRYPEVRACLETRGEIVIEDVRRSALLGPWAQLAADRGGEAIVAVPLLDGGRGVGALLLRSPQTRPALGPRALQFLHAAASLLALLLRSSGALAAVREQTRRTTVARHENERRLRTLDRYRDFLDSAPEGMVITEPDGTVLYLNRAAEQLTGFRREGLAGRSVTALVDEAQRADLETRIGAAATGAHGAPDWFDLGLHTTSGERLIVSASISAALAEVGAAIVSFRDVTLPRALEAELQQTKEFLERLIDSTIDGIIAADLRGRVILFNKGASRLTGWSAAEVVGKVPVWKLYPPGQAQVIMRELRSTTTGARGQLEPARTEIVARDGSLIPVSLTASIIYEGGREVGTVGIIGDLREQLRIEERLSQAQEKLILSERQAAIAELAGTAAHELNQPLTSVMGYSELLKRRMAPSDPHFRAVDTILREAERMAEIVRKIGRITKYETKTYVGSTQILDLDKSTHNG